MSIREIFNNIINLINKLWSLIIDTPINFGYYFGLLAFILALLILGFIGKNRLKSFNIFKLIKCSIYSIYLYFLDNYYKKRFIKTENI